VKGKWTAVVIEKCLVIVSQMVVAESSALLTLPSLDDVSHSRFESRGRQFLYPYFSRKITAT
jgi:hypothetical protein